MKLNHTVVAGTFDHLHSGHLTLIKTALKNSRKVSCGLTTKKLTQEKSLSSLVQPRSTRFNQLSMFLNNHSKDWSIFPLNHPLEPAITSKSFDSIISSTQTLGSVNQINHLRQQNHLKPLQTITIDLVKSTDKKSLSSTRIRQGQVNRQGFAYHQIFPLGKKLQLPTINRQALKKPFGNLLSGSQNNLGWAGLKAKNIIDKQKPFITIAVGDIAVMSLLNQQINLNLCIVDLKTNRLPLFSSLKSLGLNSTPTLSAANPAGSLTPSLIKALKTSLDQSLLNQQLSQTILVDGEEDLSVLPAVLLSPLNTLIFYGQPNQGLVHIKVTENSKAKALSLLQKFT